MRILALDDEPQVVALIRRALASDGHEVTGCESGPAALNLVAQQEFDLVVVDYEMPHMTGLEFLTQLRTIQPSCPCILASGRLSHQILVDAINRGEINRVLEKPFGAQDIIEAVRNTVHARKRLVHALPKESARLVRDEVLQCTAGDFLQLALQPIVDASEGRVVAYEALLRSFHPSFKGPVDVLRAAESVGMIEGIASVVVGRARQWIERIPQDIKLFVNLHPVELADPEALRQRVAPLADVAHRMVFEITERSRLRDFERWRASIELVREMGFGLAVDDLGAGYNSLTVLAEVKPQYVKVDMTIVRDIHKDDHRRHMVDILCQFSRGTGCCLIAEGVETEDEAAVLRRCGAHLLQGYLFGKPQLDPRL